MASLHDLQWATAHNSYPGCAGQPDPFDPLVYYDAGFRGVELDIWRAPHGKDWSVSHTNGYSPADAPLSELLGILRAALENTQHEPMFVHLDCKDQWVPADFPDRLNERLLTDLGPAMLFTPNDLKATSGSWTEWPSPSEIPGHVIVVLSGEGGPRKLYAMGSAANAVCFPDFDPYHKLEKLWPRLVANTQYTDQLQGGLMGEWRAKQPSLLWRVYQPASSIEWLKTLVNSGANMLGCNYVGKKLPKTGFWANPFAP